MRQNMGRGHFKKSRQGIRFVANEKRIARVNAEGKMNHGPGPRTAAFANCFLCFACDTRPHSRSIDPALDYVRCPHPRDGSALCRDDISAAVSVSAGTSGLVYFLLGRLRLADLPCVAPGSFRSADRENAGARCAKDPGRET